MLVICCVVQRFFAEPITNKSNRVIAPVVDSEGKHSGESRETPLSPLLEGVQNNLRVGLRSELVSSMNELLTQRLKIVGFSVVDDPQVLIGIRHRHVPRLRKVDD